MDENLMPYIVKKSEMRMHIPKKNHKWGTKVYTLCTGKFEIVKKTSV